MVNLLTMDRINAIVDILKNMGIPAYNMGLGPNSHMAVLTSSSVSKNALIVDIYGGADAGLIDEMGSTWYKDLKGTKKVFTLFWPPCRSDYKFSILTKGT